MTEKAEEPKTVRRILGSAHKDMTKALEQTNASLGAQSHYDRAITHVAKQFGVQSKDLVLVGEFEIQEGEDGEKPRELLRRVFMGFRDSSPNPDEKGRLISFDKALQREWKPAR